MSLRRITFAVLSSFLLVTCSSCSLAGFDQNGDGTVTRDEFLSTLADFVCGDDQTETPTDNGATSNETPTDQTPSTDTSTAN
ncbi:MAG: EF-hand domain-containing protein [Pirellulales bacterium]